MSTDKPWKYAPELERITAGDTIIAEVHLADTETELEEVNAHGVLMAAAPDMLAGLKAAYQAVNGLDCGEADSQESIALQEIVSELRGIILKAEPHE